MLKYDNGPLIRDVAWVPPAALEKRVGVGGAIAIIVQLVSIAHGVKGLLDGSENPWEEALERAKDIAGSVREMLANLEEIADILRRLPEELREGYRQANLEEALGVGRARADHLQAMIANPPFFKAHLNLVYHDIEILENTLSQFEMRGPASFVQVAPLAAIWMQAQTLLFKVETDEGHTALNPFKHPLRERAIVDPLKELIRRYDLFLEGPSFPYYPPVRETFRYNTDPEAREPYYKASIPYRNQYADSPVNRNLFVVPNDVTEPDPGRLYSLARAGSRWVWVLASPRAGRLDPWEAFEDGFHVSRAAGVWQEYYGQWLARNSVATAFSGLSPEMRQNLEDSVFGTPPEWRDV